MRILACICLARTNRKVRTKSFAHRYVGTILASSVPCFGVKLWGLNGGRRQVLCLLINNINNDCL